MKASNLLCEPLVPIYRNFKKMDLIKFKGYKLVEKINLNYYSITTGLFRYKEGVINHGSYTSLYVKNEKYYNEELKNRLSIFKNKEDAIRFLEEYNNITDILGDLVLIEIELSGNLKEAICSNEFVDSFECVIGDCILSIKEIK